MAVERLGLAGQREARRGLDWQTHSIPAGVLKFAYNTIKTNEYHRK
jgi:hypothetical protein